MTTGLTGEVRLDGGVAAFADEALVQVAGKVPLAEQVAAQAAAGGVPLEQALGLTVTVELPGTVTGTNGTAAGGSVTWTPSLTDGVATPLQAEALQEDTAALRASDVERWTTRGLIGWGRALCPHRPRGAAQGVASPGSSTPGLHLRGPRTTTASAIGSPVRRR